MVMTGYYQRTDYGWGQVRDAVWTCRSAEARLFATESEARRVAKECRRQGQVGVGLESTPGGWRIYVEYGPATDRRTRWLQSGADAPPWTGRK